MVLAKKLNLAVTRLDLRNSGDTAGSKDRVVGYGAWMLASPPSKIKKTEDFQESSQHGSLFGYNLVPAVIPVFAKQTPLTFPSIKEAAPSFLIIKGTVRAFVLQAPISSSLPIIFPLSMP